MHELPCRPRLAAITFPQVNWYILVSKQLCWQTQMEPQSFLRKAASRHWLSCNWVHSALSDVRQLTETRVLAVRQGGSNGGLLMGAEVNQVPHARLDPEEMSMWLLWLH